MAISFIPEYLVEGPPVPPAPHPGKIRIRYSNDGGHNWGDWRVKDPGSTGDFVKELVWRRLGMCRHRVWEFEDTSPYPGDVLAAMLHIEGE